MLLLLWRLLLLLRLTTSWRHRQLSPALRILLRLLTIP